LFCTVLEEGFIGKEPKLKPTTWDTESTRFALMDGEALAHIEVVTCLWQIDKGEQCAQIHSRGE
jgi:hypothetical protein